VDVFHKSRFTSISISVKDKDKTRLS
jgi:hypothetical protein